MCIRDRMNTSDLAVLDETAAQAMRTQIEEAAMQGCLLYTSA